MTTLEQIKDLRERLETLEKCLDIAGKRKDVEQKTQESLAPDFWNDPKAAEVFLKKLAGVKAWVNDFQKASSLVDDLDVLYDFAKDSISDAEDEAVETDESRELDATFAKAVEAVEALELKNMLGNEGDNLGAVLTINAGAGGTEANYWSAMLMRMYLRWGERNGYKMTVTSLLEGEEAGIKSATIEVEGDYAYGYLKAENGVHRLVRISPFNAQGKRQTTFSSVFVYPLVDESIHIGENKNLSYPAICCQVLNSSDGKRITFVLEPLEDFRSFCELSGSSLVSDGPHTILQTDGMHVTTDILDDTEFNGAMDELETNVELFRLILTVLVHTVFPP